MSACQFRASLHLCQYLFHLSAPCYKFLENYFCLLMDGFATTSISQGLYHMRISLLLNLGDVVKYGNYAALDRWNCLVHIC